MGEVQGSTLSTDGTRIGWSRSGQGPPLVLVHGTTADRTRWDPLLPTLSERCTTVAVDRRGRGLSEPGANYHVELEFDDIARVVETVSDELGPVHLLGHSYGALCCLEAAMHVGQDQLRSLILYEPPMPEEASSREVLDRIDAALSTGDPDRALRIFFADIAMLPEQTIDMLAEMPSWRQRMQNAHTLSREENLTYTLDPRRVSQITVPTLLLSGSESPPEMIDPIDRLAAALPRASRFVFEGQHHNAMDTAPDLFVETVLDWVVRTTD